MKDKIINYIISVATAALLSWVLLSIKESSLGWLESVIYILDLQGKAVLAFGLWSIMLGSTLYVIADLLSSVFEEVMKK